MRSEGFGVLLAVFLGSFLFWMWHAIFVRQRLACGATEEPALCLREWLIVIAPTVGIGVSAWLIIRQIKIGRAQILPPALEYFEETNKNLSAVRWAVSEMQAFSKNASRIYGILPRRNVIDITAGIVKRIDVRQLNFDIIACHLEEKIHDLAIAASGDWNDYCETLEHLLLDLKRSELTKGKNQNLEDSITGQIAAIPAKASAMLPKLDQLKAELNQVFFDTQRRLIRIRRSVTIETDDE